MAFENLLTTTEGNTRIITFNRPDKLNALNKKTVTELGEAIQQAVSDASVKGIILTGAGNKSFVAGADISEFGGLTVEQGKEKARFGQNIFFTIERCPKPVIAAVNGFALGGGCELAMSCHVRVAADTARFGQPEVNLGLIPGYAGTQRLVQLIGKGKALELLMTADMMKADEALRYGLVTHVVPADQLLAKCQEILEKIYSKGPVAITGVINSVNAYFDKKQDGFNAEIEEFGKCYNTEDFTEGTTAFLEKRKANFKGK